MIAADYPEPQPTDTPSPAVPPIANGHCTAQAFTPMVGTDDGETMPSPLLPPYNGIRYSLMSTRFALAVPWTFLATATLDPAAVSSIYQEAMAIQSAAARLAGLIHAATIPDTASG